MIFEAFGKTLFGKQRSIMFPPQEFVLLSANPRFREQVRLVLLIVRAVQLEWRWGSGDETGLKATLLFDWKVQTISIELYTNYLSY